MPIIVPEWGHEGGRRTSRAPSHVGAGERRPVAQIKSDTGAARAHRFAAAWAWLLREKRRAPELPGVAELTPDALGVLTHGRVAVKVRKELGVH